MIGKGHRNSTRVLAPGRYNPFFKEVSVADTELTTGAGRDLEEIIELSEQLKKDSERFEKAVREKVP